MRCRVSTAKPSRCRQASTPVSHVDLTQPILTAALGVGPCVGDTWRLRGCRLSQEAVVAQLQAPSLLALTVRGSYPAG